MPAPPMPGRSRPLTPAPPARSAAIPCRGVIPAVGVGGLPARLPLTGAVFLAGSAEQHPAQRHHPLLQRGQLLLLRGHRRGQRGVLRLQPHVLPGQPRVLCLQQLRPLTPERRLISGPEQVRSAITPRLHHHQSLCPAPPHPPRQRVACACQPRSAHRNHRIYLADAWTGRFAALYAAHRALAAAPGGTGEHARAAAAFDAALEEIDAYRRIQGRRPDLLHPAAAKALATLDREWGGLVRHRDFPDLPLDNNTAERAIRTPVVGRKNYNGSGAEWSADLAGHAWTVLGTARITGHNPRAYLDAYLQACAANGGKPPAGQALEALLPWNITLTGQPGEPDGRKDQPP